MRICFQCKRSANNSHLLYVITQYLTSKKWLNLRKIIVRSFNLFIFLLHTTCLSMSFYFILKSFTDARSECSVFYFEFLFWCIYNVDGCAAPCLIFFSSFFFFAFKVLRRYCRGEGSTIEEVSWLILCGNNMIIVDNNSCCFCWLCKGGH